MSGAVSGNDGRIPQEQIFFLSRFSCRCAGSFQSLKPGTRRTPSSTRRRLSGWTAYRARSCGMKGVFFCGCLPVEQFRQSGGFIFPSSPEISKVRDMTACTTGADLIFPERRGPACRGPDSWRRLPLSWFSALCIQGDVEAFSSLRLNSCLFHFRFRDDGGIFRNSRSRCIFHGGRGIRMYKACILPEQGSFPGPAPGCPDAPS